MRYEAEVSGQHDENQSSQISPTIFGRRGFIRSVTQIMFPSLPIGLDPVLAESMHQQQNQLPVGNFEEIRELSSTSSNVVFQEVTALPDEVAE